MYVVVICTGQELGDSRHQQEQGGSVQAHNATDSGHEEQSLETSPLAPDTGKQSHIFLNQ